MSAAAGPLALTFDDGPSPWTAPILDALAAAGARATFFLLGEHVDAHPDAAARIAAAGHELGSHGYSHRPLDTLPPAGIRAELERAADAIERAAGVRPRRFRAPHLRVSPAVLEAAAACGYGEPVGGELVRDWELDDAQAIAAAVLARAAPGAILVLHDGRPPRSRSRPDRLPTVAAVSTVAHELQARGFRLVTVSELLD